MILCASINAVFMTIWQTQSIGFLALVFAIASFQKDSRRFILLLQIIAGALYAIHFFFLGAFTGAIMNVFGVARNSVFSQRETKKWANSRIWLFSFLLLFLMAGILTWEGWHSMLPILGMASGTIALWLKNTKHIRLIALTSPPSWFAYNLMVGSIPRMLTEIFLFLSIIVGMLRFDFRGNPKLVSIHKK
jgi:hypothetical protein